MASGHVRANSAHFGMFQINTVRYIIVDYGHLTLWNLRILTLAIKDSRINIIYT